MADEISSLGIEINYGDVDGAKKSLDALITSSENTERSTKKITKEFDKADISTKKYNKSIDSTGSNLSKISKDSNSASNSVNKLTKRIGILAGGYVTLTAAIQAANYSLDNVAIYERFEDQLVTATGSLESANLQFESLSRLAAETPFQLNNVVDGFIKLKNLGLDPSERALLSYGNTASAMGKDINQLIEAVADASVGEFERLKEFGIKASSEGDKVRFTFGGITETIGKNSAEIQKYLIELGESKFAGGMERQADNLDTVFSNLGASAQRLTAKIANESGLTYAVKEVSIAFTDWFNSMSGVPRSVSAVESEIQRLQNALESASSPRGRKGIAERIKELREELQLSRSISSNASDIKLAIEKIDSEIKRHKETLLEFNDVEPKEKIKGPRNRTKDNPAYIRYKTSNEQLSVLLKERKALFDRFQEIEKQNSGEIAGGTQQSPTSADNSKLDKIRADLADEENAILLSFQNRQNHLANYLNKDASFKDEYYNLSLENLRQFQQAQTNLDIDKNNERISNISTEASLDRQSYDLRIAELQRFRDQGVLSTSEYYDRVEEAGALHRESEVERENARYELELQNLNARRQAKVETVIPYNVLEQQLLQEHQNNLSKIEKQGLSERERFQQLSWDKQAKSQLGNLLQFTSQAAQHDKKLFKINKVASIANATISTYQGAAKALEWGYPLGPIFAAAIVAAGIKNVQAIKAQRFGGGSSTGGIGATGGVGGLGGSAIPSVDIPSQQNVTNNQTEQRTIQIIFNGNINGPINQDELAESISDLIDREVITVTGV